MPIYEYLCQHCGKFEEMQRITDPALTRCPTCRRKVKRLISSTSFQLKGSGWYVTDYARAGSGNGKKDGEASAKPEGKSETSTETKTDASSASKSETKPEPSGSKSST